MIVQRVYRAELAEVNSLDETDRNTGGFGHTGK
jgi:dUTP pyrophosphatase